MTIGAADVRKATVIGFPFGYHTVAVKKAEAENALTDGADELDVVVNLAALKTGRWDTVTREIEQLSALTSKADATLKLIIETGILTDEEIIRCCEIARNYPIQFLKTSTGFGGPGASVHAVQLMRKHLPPHIQIKASGGIKTAVFAKELIEAGATRLGCSASVEIVTGESATTAY